MVDLFTRILHVHKQLKLFHIFRLTTNTLYHMSFLHSGILQRWRTTNGSRGKHFTEGRQSKVLNTILNHPPHSYPETIDWSLNSDSITRSVYIWHYICSVRNFSVYCLFFCLLLSSVGICLLIFRWSSKPIDCDFKVHKIVYTFRLRNNLRTLRKY